MKKLLSDAKYLTHVMFHPFDGFFETKHRGRGNCILATIMLILYGLAGLILKRYTGYMYNGWLLQYFYFTEDFIKVVSPVILFFVANWSTTSLMNGNGRFRDIYVVVCYSLIPLILFNLLYVLLSNVLVNEEIAILMVVQNIGRIWFCLLIFCGLCTIHEYTASQNIVTILVTFVALIIILFLILLYVTLVRDKVWDGFIKVIASEISKRW